MSFKDGLEIDRGARFFYEDAARTVFRFEGNTSGSAQMEAQVRGSVNRIFMEVRTHWLPLRPAFAIVGQRDEWTLLRIMLLFLTSQLIGQGHVTFSAISKVKRWAAKQVGSTRYAAERLVEGDYCHVDVFLLAFGDGVFGLQLRSLGIQQGEKVNNSFAIAQARDIRGNACLSRA